MSATSIQPGSSAAVRGCAACTLCCKIMKIDALNKPRGVWCRNCRPEWGCVVYQDKPQECTTFMCGYLTDPRLGEEWKPSKSKIVLVTDSSGNRLVAHVDPQRPNAWKQEPYYSGLKEWARSGLPLGKQVAVCIGQRTYFILPDRDVDLGIVGDDDCIVTGERATPDGIRLDVQKVHKDDPRIQTLPRRPVAEPTKPKP